MTANNEHQDRLKKHKEKVMQRVQQKQLYSVMNDTKWRELQNAVKTLQFPPPYQIKYVCDENPYPETFDRDVSYWGDWSGEGLLPFFGVEWICVRPRYIKCRGKLIDDEIIDETIEFIAIMNNFSIPYIEKEGAYYIYGYKK